MRKIYGYKCSAFENSLQGHCWQMHFCWLALSLELCRWARAFHTHLVPLHGSVSFMTPDPARSLAQVRMNHRNHRNTRIVKAYDVLLREPSPVSSSCRWGHGALRSGDWLFQIYLMSSGKICLRIQIFWSQFQDSFCPRTWVSYLFIYSFIFIKF